MRFKFRFSLFKLLVLFTVVAILLSVVGKRFYDSKAQGVAVEALRSDGSELPNSELAKYRGGWVEDRTRVRMFYDFESANLDDGHEPFLTRATDSKAGPQPSEFVDWFGLDFCHDVDLVEFDRELTSEDVKLLRMMCDLKSLNLEYGALRHVSLEGLGSLEHLELYGLLPTQLGELRKLKSLKLNNAYSANADQANEICQLKALEKLDMEGVSAKFLENFSTSESVQRLRLDISVIDDLPLFLEHFPNLIDLRLSGAFEVDSLAISEVGKLTRLEKLILSPDASTTRLGKMHPFALFKSKTPNPGDPEINWQPLSKLTKLKHCSLEFNEFTDEGLRHLCLGAKELEHLAIGHSQVGNAGIDFVDGLSKIKALKLGGTAITKSGLEGFKQARPRCKIYWD